MKPVIFIGSSRNDLRAFPTNARRLAGLQLDRVQRGLEPNDWKPLKTIGQGVHEIRIRDAKGGFRIIYTATFADAVYVLHVFEKKTQKTPLQHLDLATIRFRELKRRSAR